MVTVDRLKRSLAHAYANTPHYRQAFDAAGVTLADLRTLEDLARFPFTTKADLRANYPFGTFVVLMEQVSRIHASSGTTARPTLVGYTAGGRAWLPARSTNRVIDLEMITAFAVRPIVAVVALVVRRILRHHHEMDNAPRL